MKRRDQGSGIRDQSEALVILSPAQRGRRIWVWDRESPNPSRWNVASRKLVPRPASRISFTLHSSLFTLLFPLHSSLFSRDKLGPEVVIMSSGPIIIGIKGHVVSIEPATGRELWRRKIRSSSIATVRHLGDRVWVGTRGEVIAIGISTGSVLWENPLKGTGYGAIFFADTGRDDSDVILTIGNRVVSLHASTGSENWRTTLGSLGNLSHARVVSSDRIVAANSGKLYGLDRRTGTIAWVEKLSGLGHGFISMGGGDAEAAVFSVMKAQQNAAAAT
ncbi:MAG: PQQ-like beta-propeller repeat protein [Acidobacteria bacterium]|nr:PQQ-like beta-propeller repeat protein [Acidobacteriota bacterium]